MNIGDLVERKDVLGYKGILLHQLYMMPEESQLSLYEKESWSYWKILWFQHPYETVPLVDGAIERDLYKVEKKRKKNGLQNPKI
tara:strand:+ start:265 stop:516 length:252 start_codon:yes stop_codon:yes gene_type:complete